MKYDSKFLTEISIITVQILWKMGASESAKRPTQHQALPQQPWLVTGILLG